MMNIEKNLKTLETLMLKYRNMIKNIEEMMEIELKDLQNLKKIE